MTNGAVGSLQKTGRKSKIIGPGRCWRTFPALTTMTARSVNMAKANRICSVEGCGKPFYGRGLCQSHLRCLRLYGDPLANRNARRGDTWRFIEDVAKRYDGDDCLIWPFGGGASLAYPQVMKDRKTYSVTRMLCEARNGPPTTSGLVAAHSCGKAHLGCVNPRHLRWATDEENSRDRNIHGTAPIGARPGTAKLTEEQVRYIKTRSSGASNRDLGRQFGVSKTAIQYIRTGRNWGWLS